MYGWVDGHHPRLTKVNLFSKLYITFILQYIAFIFGRDEEKDQWAFHMQVRHFSLSLLFKKPVHNTVRSFSCFWFVF